MDTNRETLICLLVNHSTKPADANGLLYYAIQCQSGSRLNMSILTTCRLPFFTEVLQPLPSRYCWCRCPSFSSHVCYAQSKEAVQESQQIAVKCGGYFVELVGHFATRFKTLFPERLIPTPLGIHPTKCAVRQRRGAKENKRTNGQKTVL